MDNTPTVSAPNCPDNINDLVQLTTEPLEKINLLSLVGDDCAGAVASFIGTTRDHFHGKKVVRLEYEAYIPMAQTEIRKLIAILRSKWKVHTVAIIHRLG
eukprot:933953_1